MVRIVDRGGAQNIGSVWVLCKSPMLPTLPDFVHGTRLAASLNGEKRAFSFSPRWSEDEARRIQRPMSRAKTQPRRVSGRCTYSGPSTFLTDYLVICGRASARSMDPASDTLKSPLDSSKHIIAQLLRPIQRSLMQEFQ